MTVGTVPVECFSLSFPWTLWPPTSATGCSRPGCFRAHRNTGNWVDRRHLPHRWPALPLHAPLWPFAAYSTYWATSAVCGSLLASRWNGAQSCDKGFPRNPMVHLPVSIPTHGQPWVDFCETKLRKNWSRTQSTGPCGSQR